MKKLTAITILGLSCFKLNAAGPQAYGAYGPTNNISQTSSFLFQQREGVDSGNVLYRATVSALQDAMSVRAVNVKSPPFNAYGDDTHDDTAAIQYAIDYAWSNGNGHVFLPPGYYKISGNGIKFHPNFWAAGSGNAVNGTNYVGLIGIRDQSIIDGRAITNGPIIAFATDPTIHDTYLNAFVKDITVYGSGWAGTIQSNIGANSNGCASIGIYFGYAGSDAGGVVLGSFWAKLDTCKVMWCNTGVCFSNSVSPIIWGGAYQENYDTDIRFTRSDTAYAWGVMGGTVSPALTPTHSFIRYTPPAATRTSGNGLILEGPWECNGMATYYDGSGVSGEGANLLVIGGDVEDPTYLAPAAFLTTNQVQATFISPRSNMTNMFRIKNSGLAAGITIINPTVSQIAGTRVPVYVIESDDGLFSLPKIIGSQSGANYVTVNDIGIPNCVINTNNWINLADFDVMRLRNGRSFNMGGNFSSSILSSMYNSTNTDKSFTINSYSRTNGVDMLSAAGSVQQRLADVGVLNYYSDSSEHRLVLGAGLISGLQGLNSIYFATAPSQGAQAVTNATIDAQGAFTLQTAMLLKTNTFINAVGANFTKLAGGGAALWLSNGVHMYIINSNILAGTVTTNTLY